MKKSGVRRGVLVYKGPDPAGKMEIPVQTMERDQRRALSRDRLPVTMRQHAGVRCDIEVARPWCREVREGPRACPRVEGHSMAARKPASRHEFVHPDQCSPRLEEVIRNLPHRPMGRTSAAPRHPVGVDRRSIVLGGG